MILSGLHFYGEVLEGKDCKLMIELVGILRIISLFDIIGPLSGFLSPKELRLMSWPSHIPNNRSVSLRERLLTLPDIRATQKTPFTHKPPAEPSRTELICRILSKKRIGIRRIWMKA